MPDPGGVVADAEVLLDHFGHALQRPEFGRIAVLGWPAPQQLLQPLELPVVQLGPGARVGFGPKRRIATFVAGLHPLRHGSGRHTQLAGYLGL
jgi:hypothetical protein